MRFWAWRKSKLIRPGPSMATINSGVAKSTHKATKILFKSPAKNTHAHRQEHTNPTAAAQPVCDEMIRCGILAIWNFAPVHLNAPENILVQNENMAASLAMLSKHLNQKLKESK